MSTTHAVLTIGTFDVLHFGHFNFLRQCAEFGTLTVGLNTDEFITKYKGQAPLFSYEEREAMLSKLPFVSRVYPYNGPEDNDWFFITQINPKQLLVGSDWAEKDYYAQMEFDQEYLDELHIVLSYIPYTPDISTTEIKKRVLEQSNSNSHD